MALAALDGLNVHLKDEGADARHHPPEKNYPGRMPEAETVPGVYKARYSQIRAIFKQNSLPQMIVEISHPDLEHALSLERFSRYLAWAGRDRERAIDFYTLNTRLSESLYVPLQTVEVALRNRIHTVMSEVRHERWFCDAEFLLGDRQPEQLAKAIQDIQSNKKEATAGRIVAELTFGFWTGMVGKVYEDLWQSTLHRIGNRPDGKGLVRKDVARPLPRIRLLRNRIAHHEPIIMLSDLREQHERMLELTEWLAPAAAAWCRKLDRFDEVYPAEGIVLALVQQDEAEG